MYKGGYFSVQMNVRYGLYVKRRWHAESLEVCFTKACIQACDTRWATVLGWTRLQHTRGARSPRSSFDSARASSSASLGFRLRPLRTFCPPTVLTLFPADHTAFFNRSRALACRSMIDGAPAEDSWLRDLLSSMLAASVIGARSLPQVLNS